jgi:hypothetical protein
MVHFLLDVKHAGCHKSRLVADIHFIDIIYSDVVSLSGLLIVLFLAELNQLQI